MATCLSQQQARRHCGNDLALCPLGRHAIMENIDFDWLDGDYALNYEFSTSSSPRASPAAERVDQPSGEHALPLLRLSGWKSDKQYDKNNPVCIHYDFRWKVSQRENIRARHVCSDTDR